MPLFTGSPRAVRYLLFALVLLLYFPAAFPASGNMLELWFEYDGHPLKPDTAPEVSCFQQPGMAPVTCSLYRSDDGRYWISRPPAGHYLVRVSVDANKSNPPLQPGDYYRDYSFTLKHSTTGPLLISLHRLMTLQQPQSNLSALPGQGSSCDNRPVYSAAILALFPSAKVDFAWRPLAGDAHYRYTLWRARCSDGMRLEQMFYHDTGQTRISAQIPPNKPGEYYQLELSAVSDNQTIGELLLHDGHGKAVGTYRFRVHDPLIDRSWLYYALGVLLMLFMAWVVVGALRSRPSETPSEPDIKPRSRGLRPIMLIVLLALGAAGYWQRGQLLPWLEQTMPVLQQWAQGSWEQVRGPAGESAASTSPAPVTATKPVAQPHVWRGVIVSASNTPFFGQSRRAEVRLQLQENGVQLSFRQGGKWQNPIKGRFRRQAVGEGMTLFGHARGEGYSELWTISIPDTAGKDWRLSMDRMITRRTASGEVVSSERRRASGELHPAGGR